MDILWAISNPPAAPPAPAKPPRLSHRSSTSFGSIHYDDLLPTPGSSIMGMSGASLIAAAQSQQFAIPTPPYSDGTWEMYQDFVGGLQFWGYALASGSGDGAVRMWDSELHLLCLRSMANFSAHWTSTPDSNRTHCAGHLSAVR